MSSSNCWTTTDWPSTTNVQKTVDMILRGVPPRPEIRVRTGQGEVEVVQEEQTAEIADPAFNQRFPALARASRAKTNHPDGPAGPKDVEIARPPESTVVVKIFPYGIARTRLERAIREKRAPAIVTSDIEGADAVMAIRSTYQNKPRKIKEMAGKNVRDGRGAVEHLANIASALEELIKNPGETGSPQQLKMDEKALAEVQAGIDTVLASNKPFELAPQSATVRKAQFQIIESRRLASEAIGEDPNRRVRILPVKMA